MTPLSDKLLKWYRRNGRVLPWRDHPDPYAIWVSEIMLQQTQVETVIPYFARWMDRFPSIQALASASEDDVLSEWEGLGYYSRARNLLKASRIILLKFGGSLPQDLDSLRSLPGIGRYTAGAIGSMAFGLDAAALDGNIRRVLSRLFNIKAPVDDSAGEKLLWSIAQETLPHGKAGEYNQALMDLGAMICLPKTPNCIQCPVRKLCQAYQLGVQDQLPLKKIKKVIPHYTVTAAVILRKGRVLLAKRPGDKLLGGMWEFPGGKVEKGETLEECLAREIHEELETEIQIGSEIGQYRHAYTHFRITVHAFICRLTGGEPRPVEAQAISWVELKDLESYPMGKVDRQIAREISLDGDKIIM